MSEAWGQWQFVAAAEKQQAHMVEVAMSIMLDVHGDEKELLVDDVVDVKDKMAWEQRQAHMVEVVMSIMRSASLDSRGDQPLLIDDHELSVAWDKPGSSHGGSVWLLDLVLLGVLARGRRDWRE